MHSTGTPAQVFTLLKLQRCDSLVCNNTLTNHFLRSFLTLCDHQSTLEIKVFFLWQPLTCLRACLDLQICACIMLFRLDNACRTPVLCNYPASNLIPTFTFFSAPTPPLPPSPLTTLKPLQGSSPLHTLLGTTPCPLLQTLGFLESTSSPFDHLQGPKVEGGHASARILSFDAHAAAAAARSGVPIDLMTVAARVDAGKHLSPIRVM